MDFLNDLNQQQRQAVTHTEGAMIILAGAGSGKTRVITYKIAYLIKSQKAQPQEILALTFTNKAAQEMKVRVSKLLAEEIKPPWINTFHALGARLLRKHISKLGQSYSNMFAIFDESDQISLIKQCLKELGKDPKSFKLQILRAAISKIKRNLIPEAGSNSTSASSPRSKQLKQIFRLYQLKLRRYNALDFNDLLLKTIELLTQVKEVRDYYQEKFRYCLVDEFQDTNRPQYLMLKLLVANWKNICVVGDDDQSIYQWRGADISNMLHFEKDFAECMVIKLEQNYRSTKNILKAANEVISHNSLRKDKTLWTDKEEGKKACIYQTENEHEEARIVVDKILSLKREYPLKEIAILYRTNFQSRPFEEALMRLHIPYNIVGGVRFFERREVKDILAYLSLIAEPSDDLSLKRIINVPPRGIGAKTLAKLEHYAQQQKLSLWEIISTDIKGLRIAKKTKDSLKSLKQLIENLNNKGEKLPPSRLIRIIMKETDYLTTFSSENELTQQNRLENLKELIASAKEYEESNEEPSLLGFLDQVHLTSDHDYYSDAPSVSLMTLHCAKGLEFSAVFLVGLEEGLFPHKHCLKDPGSLEEERRLCYVGMTRAKQRLFLSFCLSRREYDSFRYCTPSRFIEHIPFHLVEKRDIYIPTAMDYRPKRKRHKSIENIQSFFEINKFQTDIEEITAQQTESDGLYEGCDVIHPKYGRGTLLAISGSGDFTKVSVYFPNVGKKKFILKYAQLKRV